MKKYLLSSIVVMSVLGASAQTVQKNDPIRVNKSVNEFNVMLEQNQRSVSDPAVFRAPKKSVSDGVYYARPAGTYWLTSSQSSIKYLVVPPFTELNFVNLSDNKAKTSWNLGQSDLSDYVTEEGDLLYTWDKIDYGYVGYCPELTNTKVNYQVADGVLTVDSVLQTVYPFNYLDCPRYYGYQDGQSAFQSGTDVFDWDDDGKEETFKVGGFLQFFEKPAAPMLFFDAVLWATTPNRSVDLSSLKLKFYKWERDEEGYRVLGDLIKEISCTDSDIDAEPISETANVYPATLVFSSEEIDDFGTPTAVPFLIDTEYAIVLDVSGFEDSDIRFYFTNQGGYAEEMATRATPTYIQGYDMNGELLGNLSYYQNTSTSTYCYNIAYIFEVMMDGIEVTEGTEEQIAPVAGGDSEADNETGATYVWTNMPMYDMSSGEPEWTGYYDFEGIPDWASIRIDPTYYEYVPENEEEGSVRGLHLVWFNVEPLPEGVKGREATIDVVSVPFDFKAKRSIHLVQGTVSGTDGVETIAYDANGKCVNSYNLSGRVISDTSKGLTISNGKKFIRK